MNNRATLTVDRLREVLDYDPLTGDFRRKVKIGSNVCIGKIAGTTNDNHGYRVISIDGKRHRAHRLAWLYVHGSHADDEIDHIDRNPANNALSNLRQASGSQNRANAGLSRTNTSGLKGVSWDETHKKWRARIWVRGRRHCLGRFKTREAAHMAYSAAAIQHNGEFACDGREVRLCGHGLDCG